MKNQLVKISRFFLLGLAGKKNLERLIIFLSRLGQIDLLNLAYQRLGILKYWNDEVSGESFLISQVLKKNLQKEFPTIFDVGANVGEYSEKLRKEFPCSEIYAFEPNPQTFKLLEVNVRKLSVKSFNVGLSSEASHRKIYTYTSDGISEHATLYKDVLLDLHKANGILEMDFSTITLDEFCEKNGIEFIDFIKIDTEGHEMEVLLGAEKLLSDKRIHFIQFEFNEMNIISRVFLRDFYNLLKDYKIYRLDSSKLIPLFEYDSLNEIFKYQNFLASHKELK